MKKIFTFFAALVCVMSMSAVTYNVTVPAGTKACYIAGEMNSWSFTEMTKVDDTHYTLDLPAATEAMKYKYCSGPGWAYVEKDASGNEIGDRTYSAADVVKKWASVYEPSATPEEPKEEKDITVKAKVPAAWTKTITAWVWPTGGEGKEVTPTKEGDWYVYTHHCAELNIIFKNGAGWNGDANQTVDMKFSESTCIEIKAGSGKATYTVIDCESGENLGDDPVVTPSAYYVTGTFNGWTNPDENYVMTGEGNIYKKDLILAAGAHMLKVTNGTWDDGCNWGYGNITGAYEEVSEGTNDEGEKNGNILITLAAEKTVTVVFDADSKKISFEGLNESQVTISYVLMGVNDDWSVGVAMTKNEGADNEEYMLLGQTISEGDSVKVVRLENGEAKHWCGNVKEGVTVTITPDDKMGNIILTPGAYDFYYDVAADAIWIAEATQSVIGNIAVEKKAIKIVRNGQLYILHEGVMYNIFGQVAE